MSLAWLVAPPEVRHVRRVVGVARWRRSFGVEHEFTVLDAGSAVVDFRRLIHTLPVPGRRLDPVDGNAYRCRWGGVITADGREAEIATPPIELGPGFASAVVESAARGRAVLESILPVGLTVHGYSTHLNVSVADKRVVRAARRFSARFAPALMLVMDRCTSPGLLVRPRRGRLELGGEFLGGTGLRAAVVMATGCALACAGRGPRRVPPPLSVRLEPTIERFGLYVDRGAFGSDLYRSGRSTVLRTGSGRTRTAQQHLEECWTVARSAGSDVFDPTDLAIVDEMVTGRRPLPSEVGDDRG
jgi:hypothetical protein